MDQSSSNRILCFIPMKNSESTIEATLSKFTPNITRYLGEILVVDNASMDFSVQKAKTGLEKIPGIKRSLFQNSRNYGLGGSHKIAFKYAYDNGYDYLLVVHGDGSIDVSHFETWMQNEKYIKYDMLLSTRLSSTSYRQHYPSHRLLFNRFLSLLATLVTGTSVKDFGSGPMNLYRVNSFLNKYENPLRLYPNEVTLPQYLLLYGIYRKMDIRFHPVDFTEQDKKSPGKLISQFAKGILLLVNYTFTPKKILKLDTFGNFFGHTYRKVKVVDEPLDIPLPEKPQKQEPVVIEAPKAPLRVSEPAPESTPSAAPVVATALKPKKEFKLIDLRKLPFTDHYLKNFESVGLDIVESCEIQDDSFLHIRMTLDVDTVLTLGLRAFFLRLFKVYSERKIILDLNADRVLTSRQCFEFLTFLKDFDVDVNLISYRAAEFNLWQAYAPYVKKITLGYEYGSWKREEFLETVSKLTKVTSLSVNILSSPSKFYHALGLKRLIENLSGIESVILQPYESSSVAGDHEKILSIQPLNPPRMTKEPHREHFVFKSGAGSFSDFRSMGFTEVKNAEGGPLIKVISLDSAGNIFIKKADQMTNIGSLFEENSRVINKLMENV